MVKCVIFIKCFSPFCLISSFHCQVSEMAVSELPGNPNAVWTVRRHIEGISFSASDDFFLNLACSLKY